MDASVLLSDLFLDTHCFGLRESDHDPTLIGLTFEPANPGEMPDPRGTLWLDRASAELQTLDFHYTLAPYVEAEGVGRGLVEFEALPDGAWIVRRWWIRMPTVTAFRNPTTGMTTEHWVSGITETGGEVVRVYSPNRSLISQAPRGALSGVVWDSTKAEPLEGATAYLSGTNFAAKTDSAGRFELTGLPEGVFRAAFDHPRLDSLGVFPQGPDVEIVPGDAAKVQLSVPSMETVLAASCLQHEDARKGLAVVGRVRAASSQQPIPEARVSVWWGEGDPPSGDPEKSASATTDLEGRYVVCGLPSEHSLSLRASFLEHQGGIHQVVPGSRDYAVVNPKIGLPPGVLTLRTSPAGLRGREGTQGFQGRILEAGSGEPVRNAEVVFRETPGDIVVTGTTNERGFFRIPTPRPGVFSLQASALGYGEVQADSLKVDPGGLTVLEVEMNLEPLGLDPLVVVAESRVFQLEVQGFYERAERGFGHFITPEEIVDRAPLGLADLLRHVPGLRVTGGGVNARILVAKPGLPGRIGRTSDGGLCEPRLYVDGLLVAHSRPANDPTAVGVIPSQVVDITDIAAVEVHLRATSLPLLYGGTQEGCGAILIWTKGR